MARKGTDLDHCLDFSADMVYNIVVEWEKGDDDHAL